MSTTNVVESVGILRIWNQISVTLHFDESSELCKMLSIFFLYKRNALCSSNDFVHIYNAKLRFDTSVAGPMLSFSQNEYIVSQYVVCLSYSRNCSVNKKRTQMNDVASIEL